MIYLESKSVNVSKVWGSFKIITKTKFKLSSDYKTKILYSFTGGRYLTKYMLLKTRKIKNRVYVKRIKNPRKIHVEIS